MSNLTSASGEASVSSGNRAETAPMYPQQQYFAPPNQAQAQVQAQPAVKKKRNLPGNPGSTPFSLFHDCVSHFFDGA